MAAVGEHYTRGANGRDYVVTRVRTSPPPDSVTTVWLMPTEGGNVDSTTRGVVIPESSLKRPQWTPV